MPDYYREPGLYPNRDYTNQHFGEHIDPFTGALQLHYTDIFIPGSGGFNLTLQRSYNSSVVDKSQPKHHSLMGVGWSVHYGRVTKAGSGGICTNDDWDSSTDNPVIEMPDGSVQRMYFVANGSPLGLTARRWRVECAPASTPGLIVTSTDGTQYLMTKQIAEGGFSGAVTSYYTTRITDRNGNYATVAYAANTSAAEIASITANDGRSISFTYDNSGTAWRRIRTATGPSGVWTYSYTAVSGLVNAYQLTGVTRPVTGSWGYSYNANVQPSAGSHQMKSLTMPQGGSISYGYTHVSVDSSSGAPVSMISSKSAGGSWTWTYNPATFSGSKDSTTVNTPDGTITYKHWGPNGVSSGDVWKIGLLTDKTVGSIQSETYDWDKVPLAGEPNSRDGLFSSKQDADTFQPVLRQKVIVRNGASHSTTYGSFDGYGNPGSIVESGPNGGNRSTSATYFSNTSKWIIGALKDESRTRGQSVARDFDSNGNLTSISRDGVTWRYGYNSDGSIARMTSPRNFDTVYSAYYRGVPQTESRPAGVSVSRNVDSAGNVRTESVGGQAFGYGYDEINRITSIVYPAGSGVTISYGSNSRAATRGGLTETTQYNGYGYVTSVSLGGIVTSYSVDALGRRTSESNPGSVSTTIDYAYDILGRVRRITNQDNSSRTISYGSSSATVQDERGYSTTYDYLSYGDPGFQALIGIASPEQSTTIGRNSRDLISAVSQGGKTRVYGYDSSFYLTTISDPETGTTTYGRDASGNMTSRAVGGSGNTIYVYDGLERMTSASYPGGINIQKDYNARGRLNYVKGGAGDRYYTYDGNDNLATEKIVIDGRTFVASYDYNSRDQLQSITYPQTGRIVNYSPDTLGRPTQVSGYLSSVSYHSSGQINVISYDGGGTATYGQNSRLWPSSFSATRGQALINSSYIYDTAGNLTSISDTVDTALNRTLGYDHIGRLQTANGPWGSGSFNYDDAGNVTNRTLGGVATTYSYDGANRLSTVAGGRNATLTYGAYGSVTNDGSNSYAYDGVPNLICANCADPAAKVEFAYDGTNTRVSRKKAGVTTYEFYGAKGLLLLEYTPADNDRTVEHIYLGDKRVAQRRKDTAVPLTTTSTTLSANPVSTTCGSNSTLTATVAPGAAAGVVEFSDGGIAVGRATLVNGVATLVLALPRPGSRTITARYLGNTTYSESTSAGRIVNVASVPNAITLSYSPATSPFVPGQPLIISANVGGCVEGNGLVTFKTTGATLSIPTATVPLVNRIATYSFTPSAGRGYEFRASLAGDSIASPVYADGGFDVLYPSSISLAASPNPAEYGQPVQLTASLSGAGPNMNGMVTFKRNGTELRAQSCNNVYPCTYTVNSVGTAGTQQFVAEYSADTYYASSSTALNVSVTPRTTTTQITRAPSTVAPGRYFSIDIAVSSASGAPGGLVDVYDGATKLNSSPQSLFAGTTTYTHSAGLSTLGAHAITVRYLGDANNAASTSAPLSVTVARLPTSTSLKLSTEYGFENEPLSLTARITADGVPVDGIVQFVDDRLEFEAVATSNGTATAIYLVPYGFHMMKAVFLGSAAYESSEASVFYTSASTACQIGCIPPLELSSFRCTANSLGVESFSQRDLSYLFRYRLGMRGDALMAPETRHGTDDDRQIERARVVRRQPYFPRFFGRVSPQLDIDGDGIVGSTTDLLMLHRVSAGLDGDAVTAGAIGPTATRRNWDTIKTYLDQLCTGLSGNEGAQ